MDTSEQTAEDTKADDGSASASSSTSKSTGNGKSQNNKQARKKDEAPAGDIEVDGEVVYRVNAGAPEEMTFDNDETWLADQVNWSDGSKWGASGGNTVYRGDLNIIGTTQDDVYRYERWGVPSYTFDVENGTYAVRLHFAENYHGVVNPSGRVFSVQIEEEPVLEAFDVYRAAGGRNKVVIRTLKDIRVEDGQLNIDFQWDVLQPMINGIEVIRTG